MNKLVPYEQLAKMLLAAHPEGNVITLISRLKTQLMPYNSIHNQLTLLLRGENQEMILDKQEYKIFTTIIESL